MSLSDIEVRKWAVEQALVARSHGIDPDKPVFRLADAIGEYVRTPSAPLDAVPPVPDVRLTDFTALQEKIASGFTNLLNDHPGGAASEMWVRSGITEAQRMVSVVIQAWASTHIRPVGG